MHCLELVYCKSYFDFTKIRRSLNKFPDFFCMGTFIDSTHMKLVFLVDCLSSGNSVHVDHASAVKKRDHQKFVDGFVLFGLLGSGRASMLPLGTLSLGLWVIAVDPAFIAWHFFSSLKQNFIAYSSSKVQIAFLKFTSCNNQVLVGCIPIPAVAVHLNLKS